LFADKAVLIEGTTERLLLTKMIEKIDATLSDGLKLSSQYVSIVEVGGAYAHLFFDLLKFLELRTLIITDLDTVNANDNRKSCKVSEGTHTSNACIKNWFNDQDIAPAALLQKSNQDKIKGAHRLSYEIPETDGGPCGRSFEDAFMLANLDLFGLAATPEAEREAKSWEDAKSISKKSDFALEYAINKTQWIVPRYIAEGLLWLSAGLSSVTTEAPLPAVVNAASPAPENCNA
jgi:putative ATP-dependent endonuclease of OLD family